MDTKGLDGFKLLFLWHHILFSPACLSHSQHFGLVALQAYVYLRAFELAAPSSWNPLTDYIMAHSPYIP